MNLKQIYNDLIGWRLRYFKYSVKNLIKWFPIIWKDRDWDDYYIWEILKTKLKYQSESISENDNHTRAQYDAEKMRTCINLIEKIQQEFYSMEYLDYEESKFNFVDCEIKGHKQLEIDVISERYDEYISKYPLQYRRAMNVEEWPYFEKNKKTITMWISNQNQKRCQQLLFKMLDRHILNWWD